jgi:hypothetical protein
MKRTDLNGLVDALAAVEALLLLSTGLLIWLRLPAGSGHGLTVWSLDRHQWGDIHAWIAMAMVATLLVHLALHWKWIVCVVSGQDAATKRRRQLTGLVLLSAVLFTAASPFIAPIDARQTTARGRGSAAVTAPSVEQGTSQLSINGRMTVGEAAAVLGKSLGDLEDQIGLPGGVSEEERLGPLARELGISMAELRKRLTQ